MRDLLLSRLQIENIQRLSTILRLTVSDFNAAKHVEDEDGSEEYQIECDEYKTSR